MKRLFLQNSYPVASDFDHLFDSVFGLSATNKRAIAVDVRESDNQYLLEAELPGYSENDVQIRIEDNLLIIESLKEANNSETNESWLIRERQNLAFRRTFALPKEVDQEKISANFSDGLLRLSIPKTEKAKPRTIEITRAA